MNEPITYRFLNLKSWEFALFVFCSMLALFLAFFFGYRAGHSVGFDTARGDELKKMARYSAYNDPVSALNTRDLASIYKGLDENANTQVSGSEESAGQEEVNLEVFKKMGSEQAGSTETEQDDLKASGIVEESTIKIVVEDDQQMSSKTVEKEPLVEAKVVKDTVTEKKTKMEAVDQAKVAKAKANAEKMAKEKQQAEAAAKQKAADEKAEAKKYSVAKGWYVQLSSSRDLSKAEKMVEELYQVGFRAKIQKRDIAGMSLYSVLVGPEQEQHYADRLLQQLDRENIKNGKPFVKKIN